jgi:glutamate---cysteine ligase / carboxylate-amine ligase
MNTAQSIVERRVDRKDEARETFDNAALIPFAPSEPFSLGVELELMLVHNRTHDLVSAAPMILSRLRSPRLNHRIKPEVTSSMIEISTDVHQYIGELKDDLTRTARELTSTAQRMQVRVCGGGTHPYRNWPERHVYPARRFRGVSHKYGYLAKNFTVFGQHIHVGCVNADDALYLTHAFAYYVPHFVALSASSPFMRGTDTAFASSRMTVIPSFPFSGHAPPLLEWSAFCKFYQQMRRYRIVRSMKDFYWDIRPRPSFGTVEIRVCDSPLTVQHAADLAALAQWLAADLLDTRAELPLEKLYLLYDANRFQAARYGFDGNFIEPQTGERASIQHAVIKMLYRMAPYARRFGGRAAHQRLLAQARQKSSDATWLRDCLRRRKNVHAVVADQTFIWEQALVDRAAVALGAECPASTGLRRTR